MKKILLIATLSTLISFALAVALQHVPPQSFAFAEDTQLTIEIQQDLGDIAEIELNYRLKDDEFWMSELAKQETPGSVYFHVVLPAKILNTDPVEYYFSVLLKHGITEYFPAQDGLTPNYTIKPETMYGDPSPGFVLLSDEPTISADDGYVLAVSYYSLTGDVNPASIEVWVGGKDVSSQAKIDQYTILYKDDRPSAGIKKAIVRGKLGTKMIYSTTWVTEILPGTKKPVKPFDYRGTVNFASNYYNYSHASNAYGVCDNDAAAWTDFYASYGILDVQTNLYLSSLEKSNRQPVNQYTLGLKIPHIDLFAGDYSPTLSQLTLYGKNIRGIYTKLYGRYLSLLLTHGQSVRQTQSDVDISTDPGIQKSGTFKQEAIGSRVQFGNENEFMMGFNLSRHRDLVSSLDSEYYMYTRTDSLNNLETIYTTKAKDNAVISYDIRVNLPEQQTIVGGEVAMSMLNTNTIPGPISEGEIDHYIGHSVPLDPSDFSNLFVVNKNMEPFIPGRSNLAWLAYFRTYFWNNLINVQYAETGPAFNAFGAAYQMNDSRALSVTDQLNISRYFLLSGGMNFIEDNLMEHKSETNNTTSWFAQSILRLPRLPYLKAAYYNNVSKNKDNPRVAVFTPFDKLSRGSNNLSFGIGYNVCQIQFAPTQLDLSYRIGDEESDKTDLQNVETRLSENESNGLNLTMFNRYSMIPLTTQFSMSLNYNKNILLNTRDKNNNLFFGAGYGFWDQRLKPFINYRTVGLGGDQVQQRYSFFTLGLEATPLPDLLVNTSLGTQNYSNNSSNAKEYNSFTWRLLITQRF